MNRQNSRSSENRSKSRNRKRRPGKAKSGQKPGSQQSQSKAKPYKHIPKRYGVVFFESFPAAKEQPEDLLDKAKECDQLNIVIRAEGDMDDAELLQYGKVFAGAAWYLIHERRVTEGWYEEPR